MEFPLFLPEHLKIKNWKDLLKNPIDAVDFIEAACSDEGWFEKNSSFMKKLLFEISKLYYLNEYPRSLAIKITKLIQEHYSLFEQFLFFRCYLFSTITMNVESENFIVNSLIFGTNSQFFNQGIKSECYEKLRDEWKLTNLSPFEFNLIQEHLHKGKIETLWKQEHAKVLSLMVKAKQLEIPTLAKESAEILKRYIDNDNVIDTLIEAHKKNFNEWKQFCIEFVNQQNWGLKLSFEKEGELKVEILDYKINTIELFNRITPIITHLAFSGSLSEDTHYGDLIEKCPKLIGVDLARSLTYSNQFDDIPMTIIELSLASCPWVRAEHLKEVALQFPNLKILDLGNNAQLDQAALSELINLNQLITIDLSNCYQLSDDEMRLIGRSCQKLREINLQDCPKITDQGVAELVHACYDLGKLTLDRCSGLTDKGLAEIGLYATYLRELSLDKCLNLTEPGLSKMLSMRRSLRVLNVRRCDFSLSFVEELRHQFPDIEIID